MRSNFLAILLGIALGFLVVFHRYHSSFIHDGALPFTSSCAATTDVDGRVPSDLLGSSPTFKNPLSVVSDKLRGNVLGGNLYRNMWRMLKEELNVRSVLDIGSGRGESMKVFQEEINIPSVLGIEGDAANVFLSIVPGNMVHDFSSGPFVMGSVVDLCWSCWVMEHIDEPVLHNLMNTFKNCRYVAAGVAINQGGQHHVTMHPWEGWWEELFKDFGFEVLKNLTLKTKKEEFSKEDRRGHDWWATEFSDSKVTGKRNGGRILRNVALTTSSKGAKKSNSTTSNGGDSSSGGGGRMGRAADQQTEKLEAENMRLYLRMNFNQRIDREKYFDRPNWVQRGWGDRWEAAGGDSDR